MRIFSKLRRVTWRSSALVIGVAASAPSTTGRLMGGFTLPVAARWNHRTLPAGSYKFVVSPAFSRAWVYVRGHEIPPKSRDRPRHPPAIQTSIKYQAASSIEFLGDRLRV